MKCHLEPKRRRLAGADEIDRKEPDLLTRLHCIGATHTAPLPTSPRAHICETALRHLARSDAVSAETMTLMRASLADRPWNTCLLPYSVPLALWVHVASFCGCGALARLMVVSRAMFALVQHGDAWTELWMRAVFVGDRAVPHFGAALARFTQVHPAVLPCVRALVIGERVDERAGDRYTSARYIGEFGYYHRSVEFRADQALLMSTLAQVGSRLLPESALLRPSRLEHLTVPTTHVSADLAMGPIFATMHRLRSLTFTGDVDNSAGAPAFKIEVVNVVLAACLALERLSICGEWMRLRPPTVPAHVTDLHLLDGHPGHSVSHLARAAAPLLEFKLPPALRVLRAVGPMYRDQIRMWTEFGSTPALTDVRLSGHCIGTITRNACDLIAALPLRRLALLRCLEPEDAWAFVARLTRLEHLEISGGPAASRHLLNQSVAALAPHGNLTSLHVSSVDGWISSSASIIQVIADAIRATGRPLLRQLSIPMPPTVLVSRIATYSNDATEESPRGTRDELATWSEDTRKQYAALLGASPLRVAVNLVLPSGDEPRIVLLPPGDVTVTVSSYDELAELKWTTTSWVVGTGHLEQILRSGCVVGIGCQPSVADQRCSATTSRDCRRFRTPVEIDWRMYATPIPMHEAHVVDQFAIPSQQAARLAALLGH